MSGRLTPHQQRVLDELRTGKVLRSLQGWVRYGLFAPDSRLAESRLHVLPKTIAGMADHLQAHDRSTGLPVPFVGALRSPCQVEFRLRPEGGAQ